jgi:DNA-binding MarR family transcriptional regulator
MLYANVAVYKYCRLRRYIESQGGVVSSSAQILSARRSFTRLARFTNQLLRGQLTCGPLTIQQFYTLESLDEGPRTMNDLAAQVGLHQSTLTRIVDRLERDGLVARRRDSKEKRLVEVALTGAGRKLYRALDRECTTVASEMLKVVPEEKRRACVEALDLLSRSIDPDNEKFQAILRDCCGTRKGEGNR